MKKVKKLSVSRSGLIYDTYLFDTRTIGLYLSNNKDKFEYIKDSFLRRCIMSGIYVEHQKDIHYKKPFWKFWGDKDYSIAIYKLK